MSNKELIEALRTARARGERPTVEWRANLRGADLWGANLRGADLRGADLRGADLWGANLSGANLSGANLSGANLSGADLRGANLQGADLRGADLWGAKLWGANLSDTSGGILQVSGLHPYQAIMTPTTEGWWLRIGCWEGTTQELRDLVARDDGWPEARGEEITARRPLLNLLADMCDLHSTNRQYALDAVMERWNTENQEDQS